MSGNTTRSTTSENSEGGGSKRGFSSITPDDQSDSPPTKFKRIPTIDLRMVEAYGKNYQFESSCTIEDAQNFIRKSFQGSIVGIGSDGVYEPDSELALNRCPGTFKFIIPNIPDPQQYQSERDAMNQRIDAQDARLAEMDLKIAKSSLSQSKVGARTEAAYAKALKENQLLVFDEEFNQLLHYQKQNWWPSAGRVEFPEFQANEAALCQPFVESMIVALEKNEKHEKNSDGSEYLPSFSTNTKKQNEMLDMSNQVSYSNRKPDMVIYPTNIRGVCSIAMIGDVRGRSSDGDFPDDEVGHVLDMARVLLTKHQFIRTFMYCFLTDGYRFQYFKCIRNGEEDDFKYFYSSVFLGEVGWQILFGLLKLSAKALGLDLNKFPGWFLERGLGVGRFSKVYLARRAGETVSNIVLKYFCEEYKWLGQHEMNILNRLHGSEGIANIPRVHSHFDLLNGFALMVTPVGKPVLPQKIPITPNMIIDLITVLQHAHNLNIIHRDVKPENIFLDDSTNEIILIDWSSAEDCGVQVRYHGTPLYGEEHTKFHTPSKAADLCSLVKTAFTILKQRVPDCVNEWPSIQAYWNGIEEKFPIFRTLMEDAKRLDYDMMKQRFESLW